jgi:integrase
MSARGRCRRLRSLPLTGLRLFHWSVIKSFYRMYPISPPFTDQQLAEAAEALAGLSVAKPTHTQRAYAAALRYWSAWFALRHGSRASFPVSPDVVIQFLQDHLAQNPAREQPEAIPFRGPLSASQHTLPDAVDNRLVRGGYKKRPGPLPISTVMSRLSALSGAHRTQATRSSPTATLPNPLTDARVREYLKRCRVLASRVPRATRASAPLTRHDLDTLVATCGSDLAGVRDRALMLLAWHTGGRRRSELASARIEQFQLRDGRAFFELPMSSFGRRLPDPSGLLSLKPLPPEAAMALRAWLGILTAQSATHGALFRAVRHERVSEPLTGDGIRQILKRRALLARLDVKRISPNSLRSGFVRDAIGQDLPLQDILALAGYKHLPRHLMPGSR